MPFKYKHSFLIFIPMMTHRKKLPLLFLWILLTGGFSSAWSQMPCPRVGGQPVRMYVTAYGIPHLHVFTFEQAEWKAGITGGANVGLILSRKVQLQTGIEVSQVTREIDRRPFFEELQTYTTRFIEIPVELRFPFYNGTRDRNRIYVVLGAGGVIAKVLKSNAPGTLTRQSVYHQTFVRVGAEQTLSMGRRANFLYGFTGKFDPLAVTGNQFSYINGTYYLGAKIGLQLGF